MAPSTHTSVEHSATDKVTEAASLSLCVEVAVKHSTLWFCDVDTYYLSFLKPVIPNQFLCGGVVVITIEETEVAGGSKIVSPKGITLDEDTVCNHDLPVIFQDALASAVVRADKDIDTLYQQTFHVGGRTRVGNHVGGRTRVGNHNTDSGYDKSLTYPTQDRSQTLSTTPNSASLSPTTLRRMPCNTSKVSSSVGSCKKGTSSKVDQPAHSQMNKKGLGVLPGRNSLNDTQNNSLPVSSAIVDRGKILPLTASISRVLHAPKIVFLDEYNPGIMLSTGTKDINEEVTQDDHCRGDSNDVRVTRPATIVEVEPMVVSSNALLSGRPVCKTSLPTASDQLYSGGDTGRAEHSLQNPKAEETFSVSESHRDATIDRTDVEHLSSSRPEPHHAPPVHDVVDYRLTDSPLGVHSSSHPQLGMLHPQSDIHLPTHPTPDIRPTPHPTPHPAPHCTPDIHTTPESTSSICSSTRSQPGGSTAPEQETSIDEGELVNSSIGPQRHLGHR